MKEHPVPKVQKLIKWTALLSDSEAAACIRDYRAGLPYSSEAVAHYGGPKRVLETAWRVRHIYYLMLRGE